MTKLHIPMAAILLGSLLAAPAFAQDTAPDAAQDVAKAVNTPTGPTREIDAPPPKGSLAEAAQLKREHDRAIAAGDHANDPHNSMSSDELNRQQLAKAAALGNGPVYAAESDKVEMPRPNIQDPSGVTAGTLPADPDPSVVPNDEPAPADPRPPVL